MEKLEHPIYIQSDDRCIPPSPVKDKSSENNMNKILQSDTKEKCTSDSDSVSNCNGKIIESSLDISSSLTTCNKNNDDFILTVENLERVKREKGIIMKEQNTCSETNDKNKLDENIMSSPLITKTKVESLELENPTAQSDKDEQKLEFASTSISEKMPNEKVQHKDLEKTVHNNKPNLNLKTNSSNSTPTKLEHDYHKRNEKCSIDKLDMEHRYAMIYVMCE